MNDDQPPYGNDPDADDSESRAALAPFAATLRNAAVWDAPPSGLEDLVVERVRAAAASQPVVPALATPAPATSKRRGGVGFRLLPAVAAAVIAFAVGFAIANRDSDDGTAMADIELAGTELAPDASASGEAFDSGAGYSIELDVDGLPPAPDGSYYEGWVQAEDGAMVSVGTFHMRAGDGAIVLWSGVRIGQFNTLIVTEHVEREPMDTPLRILLEGPIVRR